MYLYKYLYKIKMNTYDFSQFKELITAIYYIDNTHK